MFAPGGPLARALAGFEPRAGQIEMARAVADAFESGGVVLAEAGTGTGKTLAYLVPAILSGERALVSTGTKNLQEQIYFKDIPALREALGISFTATCMKGRANYLCLHRLDEMTGSPSSKPGARRWRPEARSSTRAMTLASSLLPILQEWSARTETGDRAELEDLPEDLPFWNEVSATAETCLGSECPRYDDCFVTRMRQRAAASDVVIVNHHLLCADAAVRQSAPRRGHPRLQSCDRRRSASARGGRDAVFRFQRQQLSGGGARPRHRAPGRHRAESPDRKAAEEIAKAVEKLRDHGRDFFAALAFAHRGNGRLRGEERVRATETSLADTRESAADLSGALDLVESTLALLNTPATPGQPGGDEGIEADIAALVRRAGTMRDELRFMLRAGDAEYVYFVEFRGRGTFLRAAPIDVSKIVREFLFERMRTTVLTSATLTVDGRFDYIRRSTGDRHGQRNPPAVRVRFLEAGDPVSAAAACRTHAHRSSRLAAGREVVEILRRSRGRAFVLFTSYATLRDVQAIAEMALDYPIFVQGTAPRSQLLRQFRETPHSVLLATSSFWQGVDVVGDALSCVIIDKLPFASPADPITAARIEAIRARGGDPFGEYQVPLAILTLQQGLGRLIRHRQDRGVLSILDPRVRTKGYGRRFLASLPPAPVVHHLSRIEAFFSD